MTFNSVDVAAQAVEMIGLQDTGSLSTLPSKRNAGFGIADAYQVALEVLRSREAAGWRRVGRKVGFTNRTIWDEYGVHEPIFGYMYDRTVVAAQQDGAAYKGELDLAGLAQPRIEPEIVLKLSATPPETDDPVALLGAVEWVGHGYEIVHCHFPEWRMTGADGIADGGLHGRYIVGDRMEVDLTPEGREELAKRLASFTITLSRDGEVVAEGGGNLVLGSPLTVLAHLVQVLRGRPGHPPLQAGELVTTGTLTQALPIAPGQTWETRFAGLGLSGLRLRLS